MISRIPFNQVQQNVYTLLSTGQTIPVYDSIPTESETDVMPYIVLASFTARLLTKIRQRCITP